MKILIENNQNKIDVTQRTESIINSAIEKSLEYEAFKMDSEISVMLTDNNGIKKINNAFRNIDEPTDVLSFPMLDIVCGKLEGIAGDFDIDENLIMLGDIVVSLEMAEIQAKEYGHSLERELGFLVTHGVFHLLGYDHEDGGQESLMKEKQEEVLKSINLERI
ncbi:MAG: rRNA maturation RNase YbeY [Clostridia bacterium]|jgi:probable rRNA maturation factor